MMMMMMIVLVTVTALVLVFVFVYWNCFNAMLLNCRHKLKKKS